MLIPYAVAPTTRPSTRNARSTPGLPPKRRESAKGASSTKAIAKRTCASVSAAYEAKIASKAAICGGADFDGDASATTRRITTATAITVQIQNPIRSQRGKISSSRIASFEAVRLAAVFSIGRILLFNFTYCKVKYGDLISQI